MLHLHFPIMSCISLCRKMEPCLVLFFCFFPILHCTGTKQCVVTKSSRGRCCIWLKLQKKVAILFCHTISSKVKNEISHKTLLIFFLSTISGKIPVLPEFSRCLILEVENKGHQAFFFFLQTTFLTRHSQKGTSVNNIINDGWIAFRALNLLSFTHHWHHCCVRTFEFFYNIVFT